MKWKFIWLFVLRMWRKFIVILLSGYWFYCILVSVGCSIGWMLFGGWKWMVVKVICIEKMCGFIEIMWFVFLMKINFMISFLVSKLLVILLDKVMWWVLWLLGCMFLLLWWVRNLWWDGKCVLIDWMRFCRWLEFL